MNEVSKEMIWLIAGNFLMFHSSKQTIGNVKPELGGEPSRGTAELGKWNSLSHSAIALSSLLTPIQ